jgi:hypothetical protein
MIAHILGLIQIGKIARLKFTSSEKFLLLSVIMFQGQKRWTLAWRLASPLKTAMASPSTQAPKNVSK